MKTLSILGTRTKDTDLAWLAGVIDSDGNIGFETRSKAGANVTPRVVVTNTDQLLIDNCTRIYADLGITYYCKKRKRNSNDGHIRKPCYDLQVHRLREIKLLLDAVTPYLVNKKQRALLSLEYCNVRIEKRDAVTRNADAPYGEEEKAIVILMRQLNIKGVA